LGIFRRAHTLYITESHRCVEKKKKKLKGNQKLNCKRLMVLGGGGRKPHYRKTKSKKKKEVANWSIQTRLDEVPTLTVEGALGQRNAFKTRGRISASGEEELWNIGGGKKMGKDFRGWFWERETRLRTAMIGHVTSEKEEATNLA